MYKYKVIAGRENSDGYTQTKSVYVETSINKDKIKELNDKLTAKLGFDFVKEVCSEYNEAYLRDGQYERISRFLGRDMGEYFHSISREDSEGENYGSDSFYMEDGKYFIVVLFTLLQKIESFEFKIIEDDTEEIEFLNGAGYGLYSC